MRKIIRWTGIVLGILVGVLVLSVLGIIFNANRRLNKVYSVQPEALAIPENPASVQEGQRLVSIYCTDCHGDNLAGTDFFDDPTLAVVDAPNLTAGEGGIGAQFNDADWVRAIRHGVDPQGKALFIMPSKDFYHFNDEDLGQIIAYLKSIPAVDKQSDDFSIKGMGKILLSIGVFGDVLNAETIDHNADRPIPVNPAPDRAYGEYLVKTFGCATCHGETFTGGKSPDPGMPPGPDLTPGGSLGTWTELDFITSVRVRKSEFMPFESLSKMSDEELIAIFRYLQSLPAADTMAQ